mgnify:CR=1 FL=1
MWIRKTDAEIKAEKNLKLSFKEKLKQEKLSSLQLFILLFIIVFLLLMLTELFIGVPITRYPFGPGGCGDAISFNEIPSRLIFYFITALGISGGVIIFTSSWRNNKMKEKIGETFVCDKCNSLKSNDGIYSCDCGGTYRDLKVMKWADDKK